MAKRTIKTDKPTQPGIGFIDSVAFADAQYSDEWLVNGVFVQGQPAVIGGPKKSLKTSLALDLAISLGTGKPFLGKFEVSKRRRVAVMSGESAEATLRETAERICAAKGVDLRQDCDVLWSFMLPKFRDVQQRSALQDALRKNKIEVVIFDSLYLCLLDGASSVHPYNLFEVGPLLLHVSQACLAAGATPFFLHHATKNGGKQATYSAKPLDLDDLSFAGVGEFARQWLLVSRTATYQPGSGDHKLMVSVGGCAGQSGCWHLDIHEASLKDPQRKWTVDVQSPQDARKTNPHSQPRKTREITEASLMSNVPLDPID